MVYLPPSAVLVIPPFSIAIKIVAISVLSIKLNWSLHTKVCIFIEWPR